MCVSKRNPWLFGLGVLLAVLVVYGGHARADVTTDQSGSIIIFPKVIADGTRDTLIEITNKTNMSVSAHCVYINASGSCSPSGDSCKLDTDCPFLPDGITRETCIRACEPHNFDIDLSPQQPTFWIVGDGRPFNASDLLLGLDPGAVPAQGNTFEGELKCYETMTDASGTPVNGNALSGKACIFNGTDPFDPAFGSQVSDYSAIAVQGSGAAGANNGDLDLNLNDAEYNSCPKSLVLNHYGDGVTDSFTNSTVNTELTLVPCSEQLEQRIELCFGGDRDGKPCLVSGDPCPGDGVCQDRGVLGAPVLVNAVALGEMEQQVASFQVKFDCWYNRSLADIAFNLSVAGGFPGTFGKIRLAPPASGKVCWTGTNRGGTCSSDDDCPDFINSPADDSVSLGCRAWPGVIGVGEEFYTTSAGKGNDAFNLFMEGSRPGDLIVAPTTNAQDPNGQ